ncbi:extracellular solute-binding protein [Propioniciclava coleopterorum]|uniref:Extracellular solute-binding protein n=1 Tax=Propioniciclava coleopterorum TaxID=2714937 RepID=A0A6G7Y6P3_9ACTN|nr:extracellular solute-binding protein [Propioniciclava coleopterorum]QIK72460.1 extracellular solute-binding protein [Propioniciclava coleopterorum]
MNPTLSRRALLLGAGALSAAALAGCSSSAAPQATAGPAKLQFSFWGPDFYQRFTQQMVDAFAAEHADITVATQPSEWSSYWDKLATMVAGNTAPDVINMDGKYLAEYGGRGVLADLTKVEGLDLSGLTDDDRQAGTFEGKLYALSTGRNAFALFANPAVFSAAGVAMPDDSTWTWDDYLSTAQAITKASPEGTVGATGGGTYADLTIYLRQKGQDLFSADGVGYTDDVLAQWFELQKTIMTSGAGFNSASKAQEDGSVPYEQQAFPTGKSAMFWSWTNQLANAQKATGQDVSMLRPPSFTGKAAENGLFLKASMFWSIAAKSPQQKAAGTFVDFLLNSPQAAKIQQLNRGVPSSEAALSAMEADLSATDKYIVEWLAQAGKDITLPSPTIQPEGAADSQNSIARALQEVRFDRQTPAAAAKQLTVEITGMIR